MNCFYYTSIILYSGLASALGAFFFLMHNVQIDFSVLEFHHTARPTLVLDDNGQEWARFALDKRELINIYDLPAHVLKAFIAAEDRDFWQHKGVSLRGIVRSLAVNFYHGGYVQGASTITQQLVKLLFFNSHKTLMRKLKEQYMALLIELQYNKEHILQTYLNNIYFGCGIYGIEAASQRFWRKQAKELSLDEAATLAGTLRSPGQYCPLLFPLSAQKRRNSVLKVMHGLGYIAFDDYRNAREQSIVINAESTEQLAPHLKESLRIFMESLVGKKVLYQEGLIIQTTLNRAMQEKAEKEFAQHMKKMRLQMQKNLDGALMCMQTASGHIKAIIGGSDFKTSQFNRAFQAKRQFGSIFKPIVYATAIKEGKTFADTNIDEPYTFEENGIVWRPHNHLHTFEGKMTLARALSHSNNIITIKVLQEIGVEKVIALAKLFHLSGYLPSYPSLALGCIDGTLKEAVGMFNVFANNGVYIEPHFIKWVKNHWGAKIWKYTPKKSNVLDPVVNGQIVKVLNIGMERLRQRYKNDWLSCQAIGKTGTTNNCRTCWYCGATPSYTTCLYIGCDDNQSMGRNVYPGRTAFPIWLSFNKLLTHEYTKFIYDKDLVTWFIDGRTGKKFESNVYPHLYSILMPKTKNVL